ncbi:MAG: protein kinase [Pseudomonadota bacterium]
MVLGAFGKYELLKKVGSGGMGELYLARLSGIEGFEKLLVIKRILPQLIEADRAATFVDMFLEEARLAARLSHPNIVQIHDLGRIDELYYIAMEYVHGVDLRRLLRRAQQRGTALPLEHVVKIGCFMCEALGYAHELRDSSGQPLRLVHRDVSPHNVLVAFDGGVKLTDFGIAKVASREMRTKAGTLKGKLRYMSPEQAQGNELDRRSDLFALGVILFELTTGQRPFDGKTEFDILEAIVRRDPPDPGTLVEGYPAALAQILKRVLVKDPAQRFQTALELQLELERFLMDQRLFSSASLVGQYVSSLFVDVIPAQPEEPGAAGDTSSLLRRLGTSTPSNSPLDEVLEADLGPTSSGVFAGSGDGESFAPDAGSTRQIQATGPLAGAPEAEISARTARQLKRSFRSGEPRRNQRLLAIALTVLLIAIAAAVLALVRRPSALPVSGDGRVAALGRDVGSQPPGPDASSGVLPGTDRLDAGSLGGIVDGASPKDALGNGPPDAATRDMSRLQHPDDSRPDRSPADRGNGSLTLASEPWSEVFLNGKSLGLTPLANVRLPAGSHRLVLRNRKLGLEKTAWVRIRPNRETVLKVRLGPR